jgi:hypothetical protein
VKWVIVFLVLMNVAFFGWQLSRDQEVVVADDPVPPTTTSAMVSRLLLVSELERGVLRRRRSVRAPQPSPSPEPQPTVEVAKADTDTPPVSTDENPAALPESDVECYTIGPLDNEDDISALSAWFNAQGSQAKLRTDERREVVSTWVFLPPLESREAADARVLEMQAANIDDIYVIPRGDMANAISLGLYSQEGSLQRRVSRLENRGFAPSVLPRYRTVMASWFDVTTNADQPMTVGVLDQIFPGLIVRQVPCSEAPIAGDPAITYNSPDQRQEDSYSDNASDTALDAPGRSGTQ